MGKVSIEEKSVNSRGNPGGKEAKEQGCRCPRLDNCNGQGMPGPGEERVWYINLDCKLHGPEYS